MAVGGVRCAVPADRGGPGPAARHRRPPRRSATGWAVPGALAASRCVEVDPLVNGIGGVTLLNRLILVGSPLAGQQARIRLEAAPSAATPCSRRQQQRAAAFCSRQPPKTAHRHLANGYLP